MNYAELVAALQDYLETEEASFVAQIPTFVRQAEQRIYRTVMLPELRKAATSTLVIGSPYVARPTDFLSVFTFAVIDGDGDYNFLYDKDPSFIREAYPMATTSGMPRYYAQFDGYAGGVSGAGNFLIGPTPNAAYSVELQYYYDPPSIVTASTSWLGDKAASVLLYGALLEGYTYLKGSPEIMADYQKRYDSAMAQLTGVEIRSKRDDYKDGQNRKEQ